LDLFGHVVRFVVFEIKKACWKITTDLRKKLRTERTCAAFWCVFFLLDSYLRSGKGAAWIVCKGCCADVPHA